MDYSFTQIAVDRVNAADGQYDVMFIGTGEWAVIISNSKVKQENDEISY